MAGLWALLPAEDAVAVYRRVDDLAHVAGTPGDERTVDQRRADVFTDLLLGRANPHTDPDAGSGTAGRSPGPSPTIPPPPGGGCSPTPPPDTCWTTDAPPTDPRQHCATTCSPETKPAGSPAAATPPTTPTWTTPCPSPTGRPRRTTSAPCADATTYSKPMADGTSSRITVCSGGPAPPDAATTAHRNPWPNRSLTRSHRRRHHHRRTRRRPRQSHHPIPTTSRRSSKKFSQQDHRQATTPVTHPCPPAGSGQAENGPPTQYRWQAGRAPAQRQPPRRQSPPGAAAHAFPRGDPSPPDRGPSHLIGGPEPGSG
jgi:hypothetical protein